MAARTKIRERKPSQPIGRLSAILTSCLVISIGIVCGLDPFTIFCRASISAIVIGIAVRLIADFIKLANIPSDEVRGTQ